MTKFNIYTVKGASHGRNKFGIERTPQDAIAFALYCIDKGIELDLLSNEEFDNTYEQCLIDSGKGYLKNGRYVRCIK